MSLDRGGLDILSIERNCELVIYISVIYLIQKSYSHGLNEPRNYTLFTTIVAGSCPIPG